MTAARDWKSELPSLIERLIDGEFTAEDWAQLNEYLSEGDQARRYYRTYLRLHAGLEWRIGERTKMEGTGLPLSPPSSPLGDRVPAPPGRLLPAFPAAPLHGTTGFSFSGWPVAYLIATVICAIGLTISAVTYVSEPAKVAQRPSSSADGKVVSAPEVQRVGRIAAMVDCRWADPKTAPTGRAVCLGHKYALASGLMELTYDTGAKVILQGPATYEVESKDGGYLSLGKLTAKLEKGEGGRGKAEGVASGQWPVVSKSEIRNPKSEISNPQSPIPDPSPAPRLPSPAPLFSVRTPTATVTDLGTEFGVEVNERGDTESYVFRGAVKVQVSGSNAQKQGGAVVLHEGEAVQTGRNQVDGRTETVMRRISGNPRVFVRRVAPVPKTLDLLDIVAGGNGLGHRRERGIDPTNGREETAFAIDRRRRPDGKYHDTTAYYKLIDGVFIPLGFQGLVQLDSAGHTFDGFGVREPLLTMGSIWARAATVKPDEGLKKAVNYWHHWVYAMGEGKQFMPEGRGLLCMHANVGITFSLEAMRTTYPSVRPSRFRAVAGIADSRVSGYTPNDKGDVWVFVDGQLRFNRLKFSPEDGVSPIDVPIGRDDRFLTLVTTDGGNGVHRDWIVFGDPVLDMAPVKEEP